MAYFVPLIKNTFSSLSVNISVAILALLSSIVVHYLNFRLIMWRKSVFTASPLWWKLWDKTWVSIVFLFVILSCPFVPNLKPVFTTDIKPTVRNNERDFPSCGTLTCDFSSKQCCAKFAVCQAMWRKFFSPWYLLTGLQYSLGFLFAWRLKGNEEKLGRCFDLMHFVCLHSTRIRCEAFDYKAMFRLPAYLCL